MSRAKLTTTTQAKVFVVQHEHIIKTCHGPCDEVKFIGVYASRKDALLAVKKLRPKAGFNRVGRFYIDAYPVGETFWKEGFITCAPK